MNIIPGNKPKKILFIVPYPLGTAPSQRFRVEQFLPAIQKAGMQYELKPFFTSKAWYVLYKKGSLVRKGAELIKGFAKRFFLILFQIHRYDVIFIHREAAPLGPPIFEWIIRFIWRRKYILDFDDATWVPIITQENKVAMLLKCFWKVKYLCKWARINLAGNDYLADFATASGAAKTIFFPTVVDTDNRFTKNTITKNAVPVIGWTGSHSTIHYLNSSIGILQSIKEKINFTLVIIADKKPGIEIDFEFVAWDKNTEIDTLQRFDIGIMPLKYTATSEGKCGFKLIQYMAMGIPAIADDTRANAAIIDEGINGFICHNDNEWLQAITLLLKDETLRKQMGEKARKKIEAHYSLSSRQGQLIEALNSTF
ncbi:MAG: glycosyltransferase [Niastella sp.]|nr:glycosyltransferase [Niastella sp.]